MPKISLNLIDEYTNNKYSIDKIKYQKLDTLVWYNTYYRKGKIKTKCQIYYNPLPKFNNFINQKIEFTLKGDTIFDKSYFYKNKPYGYSSNRKINV